jgi:hypothetical protein
VPTGAQLARRSRLVCRNAGVIVAATSGWEIAIAFGTIGAALMTSWLAFSTRGLARAAAADTRANWLPVVVIESAGTAASGNFPKVELNYESALAMTVVNIGRGPAVKVTATIAADDGRTGKLEARSSAGERPATSSLQTAG